jgi:hypothetical protein
MGLRHKTVGFSSELSKLNALVRLCFLAAQDGGLKKILKKPRAAQDGDLK